MGPRTPVVVVIGWIVGDVMGRRQAPGQPLAPKGRWIHGVAFTPEGRYLLTANPDGTVAILTLGG
jgi:hypothetical protein